MPVRPTLRCLTNDLNLPIPPTTEPLDQVDHTLLAKAQHQFADLDAPHERIRAIDDTVLFKAKVTRWRGAVYLDMPEADVPAWLVAAGIREEGAVSDFYAALHHAHSRLHRPRRANQAGRTPSLSAHPLRVDSATSCVNNRSCLGTSALMTLPHLEPPSKVVALPGKSELGASCTGVLPGWLSLTRKPKGAFRHGEDHFQPPHRCSRCRRRSPDHRPCRPPHRPGPCGDGTRATCHRDTRRRARRRCWFQRPRSG